jgi:membrane fusion protein
MRRPSARQLTDERSSQSNKHVRSFETRRLPGEVRLGTPVSWQLTSVSIAVMVAISIAFLLSGSYTRVQLASGTIEPAAGAITITARRPGVLTELRVQEGQPVRHGQRLLAIQAEETLAEGGSLADRVRRTINRRERELALQRAYTQKAAAADRERLRMQIIGTRSEIAELDRQIGDQRRIMDIIAKDLARASEVAARGFISKRDLDSRELSLITGRKELYQLQQQRSSKVAQIGEIERTIQQAGANADVQLG